VSEPFVELVVEEPAWEQALPDLEQIAETAVRLACDSTGIAPENYGVCILACDDARIAELHAEFRGRDVPTNVLSWPAFDLAAPQPGDRPRAPRTPGPDEPMPVITHLGDVAIAFQTVQREAQNASIPLKDHVIHLILHGSLHLLGFDHENDADAVIMEETEARLLAQAGIPDPYTRGDAATPHEH